MNQSERTVPDVESLPSYQQERRQRIVDVTLDLLLKNAGAVEVRDVVDAADVSLATIYRYFGSKEVLFSAASALAFRLYRSARGKHEEGSYQ